MRSNLLFPHRLRAIGWLLTIPGLVLGYLTVYNDYKIPGFGMQLRKSSELFLPAYENFTNELALALVITGLLFIAFSKQKHEDELTAKIRLNALYWGILVNYACYGLFMALSLLNAYINIKGVEDVVDLFSDKFAFMIYNLFTPLIIFIGRFYYLLFKSKNEYTVSAVRFLPNKPYRLLGKILTVVLILIVAISAITNSNDDLSGDILYVLPFAMLLWVYSKEKQEDEYISSVRLSAMQIAVYANYIILIVSSVLVYGPDFILVMLINLSTIPAIFLLVFNYRLYKIKQEDGHEQKNNLTLGIL
ncbi:hypothetical protein GWR56_05260 [Mucilaginibacter sp. 14171R-50]|uniref:hypothetical protein n=1 Tax=Mucilaginibacter sp. 14171R-50 TaxID=2703789 RepID=UPI00138B8CB9|nr:hypothetical protein [Mucilaginibacter sp. 14171R-50]QHS54976.1 hypothetical protein GWR56_05260 [Mucilaginibacter sp. 14171R-50]